MKLLMKCLHSDFITKIERRVIIMLGNAKQTKDEERVLCNIYNRDTEEKYSKMLSQKEIDYYNENGYSATIAYPSEH